MKQNKRLDKILPYLLIIGGIIGIICSFIITFEKLHVLQNPNYVPECSINPVISCGSVMRSKQAAVFGFPNPLIGLVGFTAVVTVGIAMLAGAKFKRWFWLGLEAGTVFGLGFIHWLFFQSVYRIHALCIYCMIVWTVTIPIFLYVTLYNFRSGNITTPQRLKRLAGFIERNHGNILLLWYIILVTLILHYFWYYFKTVI